MYYFNHPVLEISLKLNVAYSVLRSLISFQEAPWYGLVCYVQAINTTWWGYCVTSISLTIHIATVSYQYKSSLCYRKVHLIRFISCCCTYIYKKCVLYYVQFIIITKPCLSHKESSQKFAYLTKFE